MRARQLIWAARPGILPAAPRIQKAASSSPCMRREPLAITVAATTPEDARLWISPGVGSNYGRCVDVWAPGADIISASHRSDRATEYRSGTSQAVPFVAGTAALYLQNSTGAQHCTLGLVVENIAAATCRLLCQGMLQAEN